MHDSHYSSQETLFKEVGVGLLDHAVEGFNVTVRVWAVAVVVKVRKKGRRLCVCVCVCVCVFVVVVSGND